MYFSSSNHIQLNSEQNTLLIKLSPAPEIVYWGRSLPQLGDEQLTRFDIGIDRGVPQARIDHDVPVSLCPEFGRGTFGSPGLEGHHQGQNSTPIFTYQSHQFNEQVLSINCFDENAKLELHIELQLHQSGVLEKRIKLTNLNTQPYQLNRLSLTVPLPYQAKEVESYSGRWAKEMQPQRQSVEHGIFTQENRRGRTSHEYFPGCLVGTAHFTEQTGEVWSFHLGWSGNHSWRCEAKSDGRRFVQAGELLTAGEVELSTNDSYQTPSLFTAYSSTGINGLREINHQFYREVISPIDADKIRPVHLNTWEGIYFEHDPKYICEMATQAADIGVERFIIDDGWFKGRDHDRAALGDWVLDTTKYPDGLEPVIKHVNDLGMEFGIWVEPEMVNPDSDLYRAHPDWVLKAPNYEQPTGRFQYVLNLQVADCFDYLFDHLDAILKSYNIGYFKWDMNRELVQATHNDRAAVHGQTKAVYALLDKLREANPEVEIESCSSGGGRIDYEILKRTHRFWTSDCNDALERQTIQKSIGIFFPPEVMGAHVGPQHSHTTRRTHDMNFRGLTALTGHMGVELDPVKESAEEKQAFAKYIAMHKRFRPLLHSGKGFYLDSDDTARHAYGVKSEQECLVVVAQLEAPNYMLPQPILLDWLDNNKIYRVELVDFPMQSAGLMKRHPDWSMQSHENGSVELSGALLKQVGLSLPLQDPETALLLYIREAE